MRIYATWSYSVSRLSRDNDCVNLSYVPLENDSNDDEHEDHDYEGHTGNDACAEVDKDVLSAAAPGADRGTVDARQLLFLQLLNLEDCKGLHVIAISTQPDAVRLGRWALVERVRTVEAVRRRPDLYGIYSVCREIGEEKLKNNIAIYFVANVII